MENGFLTTQSSISKRINYYIVVEISCIIHIFNDAITVKIKWKKSTEYSTVAVVFKINEANQK